MARVVQAYSTQLYVDGFFNADPHAGNLLVAIGPVSPQFRVLACACALLTPQANPGPCYHRGESA